ncbi:unnamed protein product [Fusarium graminearum]|uniref:Uncharacterized protein n=1 Tax=Gibberella zeae TaxID=5518 RepID=A0A4U9EMQ2_GIBZA|nr:unnamed protein product [Fusarium graminearum]VTO84415.1 unnamed protein product [Fusarium graminearum]
MSRLPSQDLVRWAFGVSDMAPPSTEQDATAAAALPTALSFLDYIQGPRGRIDDVEKEKRRRDAKMTLVALGLLPPA